MLKITAALLGAAMVYAPVTPAYDPADLEHLELFRECKGCDLSGAELPYAAFKNSELTGANLSGANLKAVDFYSAIMVDVDLSGADLTEANLNGAVLTGADLSGATFYNANLLGANLTDADLRGAIKLGTITISEAVLCRTTLDSGVEERDCK
ncbi:MAG: pentapeptide repeat-containing protein [Gammaproteobacteria bacterium]